MNRKERHFRLMSRLMEAGFSYHEAESLRRIEMTLHRWAEHECNGTIQRDGENGDGKPRRYWETARGDIVRGSLIPDRERGALRRLAGILKSHPEHVAYHQGDPRGCALYIVKTADLNADLPLDAQYNRGIAVCA